MKKSLALGVLCVLMGCDSTTETPGNSPGLQITLAKCQSPGAVPKIQADLPKEGKLNFNSVDSISFSIMAVLNCEAQHSFSAAIIAPDTLSMEVIDVGDTRSKCVCEKEISAHYKSMSGENFKNIEFVKFADQVYHLSAD
jgi:hypothetical protein